VALRPPHRLQASVSAHALGSRHVSAAIAEGTAALRALHRKPVSTAGSHHPSILVPKFDRLAASPKGHAAVPRAAASTSAVDLVSAKSRSEYSAPQPAPVEMPAHDEPRELATEVNEDVGTDEKYAELQKVSDQASEVKGTESILLDASGQLGEPRPEDGVRSNTSEGKASKEAIVATAFPGVPSQDAVVVTPPTPQTHLTAGSSGNAYLELLNKVAAGEISLEALQGILEQDTSLAQPRLGAQGIPNLQNDRASTTQAE
jgi:hypothetical protein